MTYRIVERRNHHAVHGIFDSKERADLYLKIKIPEYVRLRYFSDKTLNPEDFEIVQIKK